MCRGVGTTMYIYNLQSVLHSIEIVYNIRRFLQLFIFVNMVYNYFSVYSNFIYTFICQYLNKNWIYEVLEEAKELALSESRKNGIKMGFKKKKTGLKNAKDLPKTRTDFRHVFTSTVARIHQYPVLLLICHTTKMSNGPLLSRHLFICSSLSFFFIQFTLNFSVFIFNLFCCCEHSHVHIL